MLWESLVALFLMTCVIHDFYASTFLPYFIYKD